jgi:hypothetical protein
MSSALLVGSSCVAVLATLVAAYTMVRDADAKSPAQNGETGRSPDALQSLESRLATLERGDRTSMLTALAAMAQPSQAPSPAAEDAPAPEEEAADEPEAAPSEPPGRQTNELYRAYYEREARDPAWASRTEANVVTVLKDARFSTSTLQSVRCATALCKVVSAHPDTETAAGFVNDFGTSTVEEFGAGNIEKRMNEDGTCQTTMYLVRRGVGYPEQWAAEE